MIPLKQRQQPFSAAALPPTPSATTSAAAVLSLPMQVLLPQQLIHLTIFVAGKF